MAGRVVSSDNGLRRVSDESGPILQTKSPVYELSFATSELSFPVVVLPLAPNMLPNPRTRELTNSRTSGTYGTCESTNTPSLRTLWTSVTLTYDTFRLRSAKP